MADVFFDPNISPLYKRKPSFSNVYSATNGHPDTDFSNVYSATNGRPDTSFAGVRGATDGVSFDNVRGNVNTVNGVPPKGLARRTFASDTAGDASFAAAKASAPDDRERQAALSGLNDALWNLSWRGGGLNMRSKREMYQGLLGQKNDLTSQAFRADADRQIANARMANDAGATNAQLAEAGARRRGDSRQFYDELGEKGRQFDEGSKQTGAYLDSLIKDAEAQRAADKYALQRRGVQDNYDDDQVAALAKQLLDSKTTTDPLQARSLAKQQLAVDLTDTGQPLDTTTSAAGARDYIRNTSASFVDPRGFWSKLQQGDNGFIASPVPTENYPFDQLKESRTGFAPGDLVDWALPGYALPDYQITGPTINGQRVKMTYGTQQEADAALEKARRAGMMRRALQAQRP